MNFSSRTAWELGENELASAVRQARLSGRDLLDLTVSNPTASGFSYDGARLLSPLADLDALRYEPDPLGMAAARAAVARYYRDLGAEVPPGRICLTTSTSEAYSFLFRLLFDPGDEVLVAEPSYPLFDYIARLDDVRLREYPLFYDPSADPSANPSADPRTDPGTASSAEGGESHGWSIDFDSLQASVSTKTRAVIVVHPNNPTGNFVSTTERAELERLCVERDLALIVDEVFLDYSLGPAQWRSFLTESDTPAQGRPLCFVLSGLSKVCALPQMKASWIAAAGPEDSVREAMSRIEVIADTFLSMNAPVQFALPQWLEERAGMQQQIRERMQINLAALDRRLRGTSAQRLAMEGGWTAVLRVPRTVEGRSFAEAALEHDVLVQPGEFYGLPAGRAVVSLLTPPEIWERGLQRLPID